MIEQLLENWITWIHQYGPIALFFLLALGIIALPVPEDLLLTTTGFFIKKGDLQLIPTVTACILGAWVGITVSYCIGFYIGPYLISTKIGKLLGLRGRKFATTKKWFKRAGKWVLIFGYFIPGVRHFVGLIAGLLSLPYPQFALLAYFGGALWISVFLTAGYHYGTEVIEWIHHFWAIYGNRVIEWLQSIGGNELVEWLQSIWSNILYRK
jgi:membrane protein DedA with SNARE-associated domain